jgi:hypothetical protein
MDSVVQMWVAYAFGVVFVTVLIVLAIGFPRPTPFQQQTFRVVLSLAAAGVIAMVPGAINVKIDSGIGLAIRAGGAVAGFVIVYFFDPAGGAQGLRLSRAERHDVRRHLDLVTGRIAKADPRYLPRILDVPLARLLVLYIKLSS